MKKKMQFAAACTFVFLLAPAPVVRGQVGTGLIDLNSAPEAQLSGLPHLAPAVDVDGRLAGRRTRAVVRRRGLG